jgi:hypothetical protein
MKESLSYPVLSYALTFNSLPNDYIGFFGEMEQLMRQEIAKFKRWPDKDRSLTEVFLTPDFAVAMGHPLSRIRGQRNRPAMACRGSHLLASSSCG